MSTDPHQNTTSFTAPIIADAPAQSDTELPGIEYYVITILIVVILILTIPSIYLWHYHIEPRLRRKKGKKPDIEMLVSNGCKHGWKTVRVLPPASSAHGAPERTLEVNRARENFAERFRQEEQGRLARQFQHVEPSQDISTLDRSGLPNPRSFETHSNFAIPRNSLDQEQQQGTQQRERQTSWSSMQARQPQHVEPPQDISLLHLFHLPDPSSFENHSASNEHEEGPNDGEQHGAQPSEEPKQTCAQAGCYHRNSLARSVEVKHSSVRAVSYAADIERVQPDEAGWGGEEDGEDGDVAGARKAGVVGSEFHEEENEAAAGRGEEEPAPASRMSGLSNVEMDFGQVMVPPPAAQSVRNPSTASDLSFILPSRR